MNVTTKMSNRRMLEALEHPERCDYRTCDALCSLAKKRGYVRARGVWKSAGRERIWFSPACLKANDMPLFDGVDCVVEGEAGC